MTKVDAWVDRHGSKIVTGLLSVVASVFTALSVLNAQVSDLEAKKASRAEVRAVMDSVLTELRQINVKLDYTTQEVSQQHKYLCIGHKESLGCQ